MADYGIEGLQGHGFEGLRKIKITRVPGETRVLFHLFFSKDEQERPAIVVFELGDKTAKKLVRELQTALHPTERKLELVIDNSN